MDQERIVQLKEAFEEFRRGLTDLQASAARGDIDAVKDGLLHAHANINELELGVLQLLERTTQ